MTGSRSAHLARPLENNPGQVLRPLPYPRAVQKRAFIESNLRNKEFAGLQFLKEPRPGACVKPTDKVLPNRSLFDSNDDPRWNHLVSHFPGSDWQTTRLSMGKQWPST